MSDAFDKLRPEDDFDRLAAGEPGHPGSNQYAGDLGTHPQDTSPTVPAGTLGDAAKTWANTAALEAGPQIAGVMGAFANAATNPMGAMKEGQSDLDAYRFVRDTTRDDLKASERTAMGKAAVPIGVLSTPIPTKALPGGAPVKEFTKRGVKVGGAAGFVHGAATAPGDLTKLQSDDWSATLKKALAEGLIGAGGGFVAGSAAGLAEQPIRSVARRLPMDMLGVSEPARRSMQRQGIYDAAGDDLLALVKPFRSGMRKGSLTADALDELGSRGEALKGSISAVDAKSGGQTVNPGSMGVSVLRGAKPFTKGSLQDQQVASRMGKEAESMIGALGEAPISLADAEAFKQRFGPAVAKELRHAGEPAAKTTALADTYRALKTANEAGAANIDPALAKKFIEAKQAFSRLAAPLEGANIERSGMRSSDFDLGSLLSEGPAPKSVLDKLGEIPGAGFVKVPLDLAGRAYGRGIAANAAEFAANRMTNNSGGVVGQEFARAALAPYLELLNDEERK